MRSRLTRFADGLSPWVWPSRERRVRRWLRAGRRWRKKHPPRCYRCGFNLTGSRHLNTCPECGRACEWGAHWTRDGRWSMRNLIIASVGVWLLWAASIIGIEAAQSHLVRTRNPPSTLLALATSLAFLIGMLVSANVSWWCFMMIDRRTRSFRNRVRRQMAFGGAVFAGGVIAFGVVMLMG